MTERLIIELASDGKSAGRETPGGDRHGDAVRGGSADGRRVFRGDGLVVSQQGAVHVDGEQKARRGQHVKTGRPLPEG